MRAVYNVTLVLMLSGGRAAFGVPPPAQPPRQPTTYTYRSIGEQSLSVYVFRPAVRHASESASAILLFHGGGWSAGSPEWTFDSARRFADLGMVAIPVQYRLSEGNVTPIDALADVCAAFRWVRKRAAELRIDPRRVAGYGVSAGGHLVASTATVGCPMHADAAAPSKPDALLLWSPALDLTNDGWFEKKLQGRATAAAYSPVEHIGSSTPPTSIVQGAADTLTPLSGAKRYCERLVQQRVACEINVYDGVGHLLTRNLANQESDFDPDPGARSDGIAKHRRFLTQLGFIHGR